MQKSERVALWAIVSLVVILYLINLNWLNALEDTVGANASKLERSRVEAVIYPGVPAAFSKDFKQATEKAGNVTPEQNLWLTVRLDNLGYVDAGKVTAELSLDIPVQAVYAHTAGGQTMESEWNAPKITSGGKGKKSVAFEVTEPLSPGEAHLFFLALRPQEMGEPPFDKQDLDRWRDTHSLYLNQATVTAFKDAFSDEGKNTEIAYGLGTAG